MKRLEGQVAIITGGARGIGKGICKVFCAEGATVAMWDVLDEGQATADEISASGGNIFFQKVDITDKEQVLEAVSNVIAKHNKIDILINNAGIFEAHPILETNFDDWQTAWQNILNINLVGPSNLIHLCSQHMAKQGGGRVVNVSSRGAFRGEPDCPAYGASKAGMNAMGQSLAKALGKHNVFVHTVAPGFVETDMAANILGTPTGEFLRNESPLKRVAQPHEVANAVLFCASEESKFMTGCILDVNGASYLRT